MGSPVTANSEIIEGGLHERSILLYGHTVKGTWWGGSITGDPEVYVEEGSGDGHLFPYGPHWGTWKGAHLPGTLRDG